MKRIILTGLVLILALFFSASASAGPVVHPGIYSTENEDFAFKLWKERFFGCSPEKPFSLLTLSGEGFSLKRAVVESILPLDDPNWDWITTYNCGTLVLNSKGPWLKRGKLVAKGVMVTKYSRVDENNNLHFQLIISGAFENSGYLFHMTAFFNGTPDNYKAYEDEDGDLEYHMGSDLRIEIKLFKPSPQPV